MISRHSLSRSQRLQTCARKTSSTHLPPSPPPPQFLLAPSSPLPLGKTSFRFRLQQARDDSQKLTNLGGGRPIIPTVPHPSPSPRASQPLMTFHRRSRQTAIKGRKSGFNSPFLLEAGEEEEGWVGSSLCNPERIFLSQLSLPLFGLYMLKGAVGFDL